MTSQAPWLDSQFLTPQFFDDPYPLYQDLLARAPIAYSEKVQAWLVCPFTWVSSGLSDPRFSSGARIPTLAEALSKAGRDRNQSALECLTRMMSFRDDPDHARLRRVVSRAFTPRRMAEVEVQVRQIVQDLIDDFPEHTPFDLVEFLSFPLPAMVICGLLGVPLQMLDEVRSWADAVVTLLSSATMSDDAADQARIAVHQADAYIRQAIFERSRQPGSDLLSTLALGEAEGTISADEVTAMVILLLFAGFETTEGLIGNAARILLADPEWSSKLKEKPELIPAFVEEVLRFDPSVHRQSRIATADVTIADIPIAKGSTVLFMIGASGWDTRRFSRPEVFDPERADAGNVGFGHGPHFCLGAPLARMETRLAIEALTLLNSRLIPAGPVEYGSLLAVRKPSRMPVTLLPRHLVQSASTSIQAKATKPFIAGKPAD